MNFDFLRSATASSSAYRVVCGEMIIDSNMWNVHNELRLTRAAMLLTTTDTPVIEIAGMSGFNNISNFNRAFKMYYETTPSKYRRAEKQSF